MKLVLPAFCVLCIVFTACSTPLPVQEGKLASASSISEAVFQSFNELSKNLDDGIRIAVVAMTAPQADEADYIMEELQLLLVQSRRFRVVDRQNLDAIRAEQQFQLSGEVDDSTAVSIGHMLGAECVITGSVREFDGSMVLRLRALDVESGEILAMTSQSYKN